MPENALLLFPIVLGYLFLHFCYYFHFRAQRLEGNRLLVESLIGGIGVSPLSGAGSPMV